MWQKIIVWLITEIILNLVGIDDLADYSEFIFEKQVINFKSYQLSAVRKCEYSNSTTCEVQISDF